MIITRILLNNSLRYCTRDLRLIICRRSVENYCFVKQHVTRINSPVGRHWYLLKCAIVYSQWYCMNKIIETTCDFPFKVSGNSPTVLVRGRLTLIGLSRLVFKIYQKERNIIEMILSQSGENCYRIQCSTYLLFRSLRF